LKDKQLFILASSIFAMIYAALTIGFGLFVTDWSSWLGVILFIGFELLFIGIAYDITELVTSTILKPQTLPKHLHLDCFPAVALVMTVSDDVFPSTIERLKFQTYPNCHIFILDDSIDPLNQAMVDQLAAQYGEGLKQEILTTGSHILASGLSILLFLIAIREQRMTSLLAW
jgi:hypothetical protein